MSDFALLEHLKALDLPPTFTLIAVILVVALLVSPKVLPTGFKFYKWRKMEAERAAKEREDKERRSKPSQARLLVDAQKDRRPPPL